MLTNDAPRFLTSRGALCVDRKVQSATRSSFLRNLRIRWWPPAAQFAAKEGVRKTVQTYGGWHAAPGVQCGDVGLLTLRKKLTMIRS